jgi:sodium-dependent dicarboxylate transporter 2/3/5
MCIAFFNMVMTNFNMNMVAIAISLPVTLVIVPHLGMVPEVALYSSLFVSTSHFLLLVGAVLNVITYDSKQFTTGHSFMVVISVNIVLMAVVALAVDIISH